MIISGLVTATLAAIAVYCSTSARVGDPAYPDDVIALPPGEWSVDDRSLAFLTRGVLDMAGLAFDNDGRLLISATAEIVAPISSRPQSPQHDELAATIAKVASPAAPRLRAEWDALAAELTAADAKYRAISEAIDGCTDAVSAAEDEAGKVSDRVNDCARRIVKEPVHNTADLLLLAEATYWWLYSEPAGLWAPDAEAQLDGDPVCVIDGGVAEEALLALLKGVRDVGMRAAISPLAFDNEGRLLAR